VLFHDGLEVDFSILPVAAAEAIPPDAQAVLGRGFSIVYDEIELALERTTVASTPPPTQAGLEQLSNDFWYHVLWTAKKLRRGELLLAKQIDRSEIFRRLDALLAR
jgi:aminoglycoside 6-adenylyltransferase